MAANDVGPDDEWDGAVEPMVRPYAMTRGRTAPAVPLEMVALVRTTSAGHVAIWEDGRLEPEARDIALLCSRIHSIAEIGALLHLPLVVVRVLVDDMSKDGLVSVHRPDQAERPNRELLQRVLNGLSRL